jgi:ethanolaminephosphotransferase
MLNRFIVLLCIVGPEFWQNTLPGTSMTLFVGFMYLGIIVIAVNIVNSVWNVILESTKKKTSGIVAITGLLPFVFSCLLIYLWAVSSTPQLVDNAMLPLSLYITFSFGHMVGQIILAHVLKGPFPYWNANWMPILLHLAHIKCMQRSGYVFILSFVLKPPIHDNLTLCTHFE